jgi:hypothetical protein
MDTQFNISGLTTEDARLLQIFHPHAHQKMASALSNHARFVHYTSSDTAIKIICGREVWMRKSSCLNDFMEIEHGLDCLCAAYKGQKEAVVRILDGMFPGFCSGLEKLFDGWVQHFRTDTYLACISEHGSGETRQGGGRTRDEEDDIGRLSMWRAYGGKSGVALVMNGGPFLRPSRALNAYTSPVAYLDAETFGREFQNWLRGIEGNSAWLQALGEEDVFGRVFEAFRYAILCTKHPGFREEREWRIIHNPTYERSSRLIRDIQSVSGIPQPIFKMPLKNVPEDGLTEVEIPELIDRVIVGPTQFPLAIREALIVSLESAGMKDAANRVFVSDIPLRAVSQLSESWGIPKSDEF